MVKFFRLFSIKKKSYKKDHVDSSIQTRVNESDIEYKVIYLDGKACSFYLEKDAYGKQLEDYVFHQIELNDDKNYFGLQYKDKKNINHWLDVKKKIKKQCESGPPYTLRFRIKFFSSNPLQEDYTRYLFVQQLKQMIRDGELMCDDLDLAADIAALSLQGELGDYDEMEHTPAFISQFKFLPDNQQTADFELLVISKYNDLKNRYFTPAMADRQFLEKCRLLPDYGVDQHKIKDINDKDYILGLTPTGILIYEGRAKIGLFTWECVLKLSFKKNRFKIVVQDHQENDQKELEHTFIFQSVDVSACKQMWKSCVEHHAFYRLEGVEHLPTKFQQIFRLQSRFHASFHTEYQMAMKNSYGTKTKRSSTFIRTPSIRGAPRASFDKNEIERRKIQNRNRELVREQNKMLSIQSRSQLNDSLLSEDEFSLKNITSSTQNSLILSTEHPYTPDSLVQTPITPSSIFDQQISINSTNTESSNNTEIVKRIMPKSITGFPKILEKCQLDRGKQDSSDLIKRCQIRLPQQPTNSNTHVKSFYSTKKITDNETISISADYSQLGSPQSPLSASFSDYHSDVPLLHQISDISIYRESNNSDQIIQL